MSLWVDELVKLMSWWVNKLTNWQANKLASPFRSLQLSIGSAPDYFFLVTTPFNLTTYFLQPHYFLPYNLTTYFLLPYNLTTFSLTPLLLRNGALDVLLVEPFLKGI